MGFYYAAFSIALCFCSCILSWIGTSISLISYPFMVYCLILSSTPTSLQPTRLWNHPHRVTVVLVTGPTLSNSEGASVHWKIWKMHIPLLTKYKLSLNTLYIHKQHNLIYTIVCYYVTIIYVLPFSSFHFISKLIEEHISKGKATII